MPARNDPQLNPKNNAKPRKLVIFLHGYGSNGDDLISLAPYWQKAFPDVCFIAPDAPQPCAEFSSGRQWFPLLSREPSYMQEGLHQAVLVFHQYLDSLLEEFEITNQDVALVGFSQGTMMALSTALSRRSPLAGVVAFSGAFLGPVDENVTKTPLLLVHGNRDDVVPYSALASAESALIKLGNTPKTYTCPGLGHSIDEVGLMQGQFFLTKIFYDLEKNTHTTSATR